MSGTMDTAGALFNSRFDNKELRNELLNKKEERSTKTMGVVKRYRPGVVPDFAKKEEKPKPRKKIEATFDMEETHFEKKADPRLERLQAAQKARRRQTQRVRAEAELIIDDEEEEETIASTSSTLNIHVDKQAEGSMNVNIEGLPQETVEDEEELAARRRKMLLSRAREEEEEENEEFGVGNEEDEEEEEEEEEVGQGRTTFAKLPMQKAEESEEEYEYEDYDESEDEGTRFALRHRPTFIPKANRRTIESEEEKTRKAKELEELEELKYQQRVKETQRMIEEVRVQELEEEENRGKRRDPHTAEEIPDDTDDLENEEELNAWKWREFNRIIRDRKREEERLREEEEKERRSKMTDTEISCDNDRLEAEGIRKSYKKNAITPEERAKKVTFLQKYYHKGVFYLDDESVNVPDDVRNRDYHERTERDRRDLTSLPKAMQVRDFGKRSQSKWTYLRNEDTTRNANDDLYQAREKNWKSRQEHAEKRSRD